MNAETILLSRIIFATEYHMAVIKMEVQLFKRTFSANVYVPVREFVLYLHNKNLVSF